MRLSIITPILNRSDMIEACVKNVAGQGDHIHEHIVVDGGSTDGTLELLRSLAPQYPRLIFQSEPDRGQSDAMNKGLTMASGEIVSFLNADDYYEDDACREAVEILSRQSVPSLVAANCRVIDDQGCLVYWNRPRELRASRLLLGWHYYQFPCNPSAYFYHKAVHDLTGPYDIEDHFSMDLSFIIECSLNINMIYVNRHWGNMRLMAGTKTFEDRGNSEQRTGSIIRRYVGRLSLGQRLVMASVKARKALTRPLVGYVRHSRWYREIGRPVSQNIRQRLGAL